MGIVSKLAPSISRLQRNRGSQVLVSTQSDTLLIEPGIDGREVLLLTPTKKDTAVKVSSDTDDTRILLENGFTVGEVVPPANPPQAYWRVGSTRMSITNVILAVEDELSESISTQILRHFDIEIWLPQSKTNSRPTR